MSCCDIYNHSFYRDIHNISRATNIGFAKLQQLQSLFKSFNPDMSGLWQPAIILPGESSINYVDFFRRAEPFDTILDPCNCADINEENTPFEEQTLDCEYCNKTAPFNNSVDWQIKGQFEKSVSVSVTSTNCKGADDVRMYPDDYLTKLPVLNNAYLTGLYDFKNLNQFPAASNYNLGWDQFISIPVIPSIFSSLAGSASLCVDWNICEKMGEILPNDVDSYHKTIDDHEKSYNRHLNTTKTCGNFILLQPSSAYNNKVTYPSYPQLDNSIGKINNAQLTQNQLPEPEFFTKPYGFKNQDFYNIFSSGNTKIGAHWKWNYSSGIICWYRYQNIDMPGGLDQRVFPGIDIYISEGDVFFAKNHGPENPSTDSGGDVKSCPSGIKLISTDKTVSGVIPENSEFIYISENLYNKAYSMFYKLDELENQLDLDSSAKKTPKAKLELACLLATSPNYDEITVDLLQKNPKEQTYIRNVYNQIDLFNANMLTKTTDRSSNNLNLIKNKQDLLNALFNKYGSYLWVPEQSTTTISIQKTQIPNLSLDLDFQPVVNKNSIIKNAKASGQKDCNQTTVSKEYYYDQTFTIGNNILDTRKDQGFVKKACDEDGNLKAIGSVITASVFHAETLVKSYAYSSGSINYDNVYLRPKSYDLALDIIGEELCSVSYNCNKSLATKYNNENNTLGTPLEYKESIFLEDNSVKLNRGYSASFFNPNINLCGFHQDGGVYFDSNTFGTNLVFNKSVGRSTENNLLSFVFKTKDVGIKIYSLDIKNLRNKQNPNCKTLPLDQPCKCFPLKHINDYKYNCDGTLTYSNAGKVLFTPNVSTHNTPDIKAYGNFNIQEIINQYDGAITIPNHFSYGQTLPVLSRKIDPLNPYECSKSISLQLPSYNKTEWELSLDKYINNEHTDIWATVSETVDLFRSIIYVDPEDIIYDHITSAIGVRPGAGGGLGTLFGGFSFDPFSERDREQDSITEEEQTEIYEPTVNANYRRYVNEVKINGKSFYNRQTKILGAASRINIEIRNPFLIELLNAAGPEGESILYTPLSCSLDGTPSSYSSPTGNNRWLTNVDITFHQQPRKQILMYEMHPLKSMGSLKPGFFHPNSGLQTAFKGETSLVFNKDKCYYDFDYERNLFQKSEQYSASGSMYYANLTKKDQTVLDIISSLDSHKKLRLYIKSGSTWYEYLNPHIFGFYNKYNKNLYPGAAAYFEYTNYDKPKVLLDHTTPSSPTDTRKKIVITKPSPLIPASAKINIPFNYIVPSKILHPEKITYPQFLDTFYPNIPNSFTQGFFDLKSIVIDSIRSYFFFEEESNYLDINSPIESLGSNDDRIGFGTIVLDDKRDYWKYNRGFKNDPYSYEKLNERSYYDNYFSSLHFVFNEDSITQKGIVNNSYTKVKPQTVILFDPKDKEFNTSTTIKIIAKYLLAEIVDKTESKIDDNNPISSVVLDKKYLKISTVLVSEFFPTYHNGYVAFPEHNFRNAITIYQQQNSLYQEYNQLLSNRKAKYLTKWGDLVNYDLNNNPDLNDSLYIDSYINTLYPFKDHPNRYTNLSDSLVLNQMSTGLNVFFYSYNLFTKSGEPHSIKNQLINYNGFTNYVQHQKYSSDVDNLYEIHTDQYENFIPLFDIVFLDESIKDSNLYLDTTINSKNGIATTGNVFISGLRQFSTTGLISYQDPPGVETLTEPLNMFNSIRPDQDSYMIVSLENEAIIRPILFNRLFYYPTPRVDDTYFPLLNNEFSEVAGGPDCVSFTKPNLLYSAGSNAPYFDYSSFNQISNNIKRPYFAYPIYCDTDAAPDCGVSNACKYKVAGAAVLTAEYQHLEYTPKKFKDIAGSNYEYVLSADEGLYNILHGDQKEFPYIQRFEISPEDELFNQLSDNELGFKEFFKWTDYSVENRKIASKYSYIDSLFQNNLSKYKNISHSPLVSDTDKVANEMLFRLIYGTKQQINTETIKKRSIEDSIFFQQHKNAWSYLLQYTDIKTKPEKIYELIPYDYSTQSDQSRRKIKGSISIEGVGQIGVGFSAVINEQTISFNIKEIQGIVYLIANHGKDTASGILGYTSQTSETFIAVAVEEGRPHIVPTSPDQNTAVSQVGVCDGGVAGKSWSAGSYFTKMSYEKMNEDGEIETIDMVEEYKKCIDMMRDPYNCIVVGEGQIFPDDSVVSFTTTFAGSLCPGTCPTCNNRGYLENFNTSPGCFIIYENEAEIEANGLSRGTFFVNDEGFVGCPPKRNSISLTPQLRQGDWDAFALGTPVLGPAFSMSCGAASKPCSMYCNELEGEDKVGKIFDPIRIGGGKGSNGGEPCECRIPSYGYCTAARNSCDPCVPHIANNFSYTFENLYNKFQGNGHIIKMTKKDPIVHNGLSNPTRGCGGQVGLAGGPHTPGAKATEKCFWVECSGPKPPSYIIYKLTSKTVLEYNPPLCPINLAFIEYDNNTTKVSISAQTSDSLCFKNSIRTDCPTLSITLPNETFSFTDSIESECSSCDVEPNIIDMKLQNPEWQIVTEERIGVLGTLSIDGNPNLDVVGGGGQVSESIIACGFPSVNNCCYDGCYVTEMADSRQCGADAPNSWAWGVVLDCHLNGSPSPSFTPCISQPDGVTGTQIAFLLNGAGGVGFASGSDNSTVRDSHENHWKNIMQSIYSDQQFCNNNGNLIVSDIVEGVVPGSCGELQFDTIVFPATAFRPTLEGGEKKAVSYGVRVAYYKYQYRRPKTIEDMLIGEEFFLKCKTALNTSPAGPHSSLSSHNMTEQYGVKLGNCQTTPLCYDKATQQCDEDNLCCKYVPRRK